MKKYDVVVVGGGPSGASAALNLASFGFKVLIVERKKIVGTPVFCAEGASVRGIESIVKPKLRWIAKEIKKVKFSSIEKEEFKLKFKSPGYILERRVFDRDLVAEALAKGADIWIENEAIGVDKNEVILRKGERVKFEYLIIADGIESRLGRSMGLSKVLSIKEVHSCAQWLLGGIEVDPSSIELILDRKACPGGYIWIFPKDENLANVGLGISPLLAGKPAVYFLEDFVKKRFPDAKILERSGGIVAAKILKDFGRKNILLVGDAARLTDPMTGAGIVSGMLSGKLAAEAVRESAEKKKEAAKLYKNRIEERLIKTLRFHEKARKVFLKLENEDFATIFAFGRDYLEGKVLEEFDLKLIWKSLKKYAPRFVKIAAKILR